MSVREKKSIETDESDSTKCLAVKHTALPIAGRGGRRAGRGLKSLPSTGRLRCRW